SEEDVTAHCKGVGVQLSVQRRRCAVGVYLHAAQVGAEEAFHLLARVIRQWTAGPLPLTNLVNHLGLREAHQAAWGAAWLANCRHQALHIGVALLTLELVDGSGLSRPVGAGQCGGLASCVRPT